MSYLLDKKTQRKKFYYAGFFVLSFLILFYFRSKVFRDLSYTSGVIFHPVLVVGDTIGVKFSAFGAYFSSKKSLLIANENLIMQLNQDQATISNYNSLAADDASIKEILGRKDSKVNMILAAILAKPNQSLYDTLIIDAGANQRVSVGNTVFALGNVPIGRVAEVDATSSKIILFSNAGEKTEVIVPPENISMDLLGRGGGNFEMVLPKDVVVNKGDEVALPGINAYTVAIAQTIISDPRDPFTKALLVSPVNIEELKFVEVEK